jgi:hypothetical protein
MNVKGGRLGHIDFSIAGTRLETETERRRKRWKEKKKLHYLWVSLPKIATHFYV